MEIFDHSMISLYRTCPKKFHWRMIRHLSLKGEKRYVTGFGGALHNALDSWYSTGDVDASNKAFVDSWMPHEGEDPSGKRCLARGLMILTQYRERYATEPFTLLGPDYIEVGFSMELEDFIIVGKMDGIVHWETIMPGYIIFEHKFSNSKGFLITEPNHQIDTYIWAASKILGKPVVGALFNQVYHTAKDITKNEFVRELTHRTADKLRVWEEETLGWLRSIVRSNELEQWPMNTNSCGAFFRACEYTHLCLRLSRPQEIEDLIPVMYEEKPWEPFPDARKGVENDDV